MSNDIHPDKISKIVKIEEILASEGTAAIEALRERIMRDESTVLVIDDSEKHRTRSEQIKSLAGEIRKGPSEVLRRKFSSLAAFGAIAASFGINLQTFIPRRMIKRPQCHNCTALARKMKNNTRDFIIDGWRYDEKNANFICPKCFEKLIERMDKQAELMDQQVAEEIAEEIKAKFFQSNPANVPEVKPEEKQAIVIDDLAE